MQKTLFIIKIINISMSATEEILENDMRRLVTLIQKILSGWYCDYGTQEDSRDHRLLEANIRSLFFFQ